MALVRHPNLVLVIAAVLGNPEEPELLDTDLCSDVLMRTSVSPEVHGGSILNELG